MGPGQRLQSAAFSANRKAPTGAACAGYANTFNVANSGEGAASGRRSLNTQKVAFTCFRPAGTPLSTTANQKLFGAQFLIDGSTSLESGLGTCGGCPLSAGGGGSVTLLAVFQPAEAYDNVATGYVLTSIDGIIDMQVEGVLAPTGSAAFWDWDQVDGCNGGSPPIAVTTSRFAPAGATCAGYTNTWNAAGGGEGVAASRRSTNIQKMAFGVFRPPSNPLVTTFNQKLFGIQFIIDGSHSLEASGGPCGGCYRAATIVWNECTPGVLIDAPTTRLNLPSVFTNYVYVNRGAIATKKQSWGQLKSMYR